MAKAMSDEEDRSGKVAAGRIPDEIMKVASDSLTLELLRDHALSLGWDDMGITSASIPEADVQAYRQWLANGYQAEMSYMENQIRCEPQKLLPGARSAILFVTYYKQPQESFMPGRGLIASYARGKDYHHLHRKRLKAYIHWLEKQCGQINIAKGFSDSTPLLEKALAVQAGLGWLGKNSLLIHRRFGTFTLLSGILTTLELPQTEQKLEMRTPRCGNCTRCIDACPTQAIVRPYQLDARRCLSYHLIESKVPMPEEIQAANPGYAFGCDICQTACPHNFKKPIAEAEAFSPSKGVGVYLTPEAIQEMQRNPEKLHGTPLQRKGVEGLLTTFASLRTR